MDIGLEGAKCAHLNIYGESFSTFILYCYGRVLCQPILLYPLQWRHNGRACVPNHRHLDCLLNRLFRRRPRETPKLRVTDFGEENSPMTGEFPSQRASNAKNVSIWWRHHATITAWHGNVIRITASGPFVRGIHRSSVDSLHKGPVMLTFFSSCRGFETPFCLLQCLQVYLTNIGTTKYMCIYAICIDKAWQYEHTRIR